MQFMHQSYPKLSKLSFDSRTSGPSRCRWKRNIVSLQSYARIQRREILWRVFNHMSLIFIDCHCYCRVMQSSIGQFGSTVGMNFLCYKLQFFFAQLNPLKGFHFVNFLQFPLRDGCHWPGSRAQLLASSSHTWSCDLMRATS